MLQSITTNKSHLVLLFNYLFGAIGKFEYRRQLGDKELAKSLWLKVKNNGYVLRNCKLYIYALAKNRKTGVATSPTRFGICAKDVPFLKSLNIKFSLQYKAYSLSDFDNLEGAILKSPHLDAYMGKYINKKLRFLASYGVTKSEIRSEFICESIYALRKQYPRFKSELHAQNICKTTIHNTGQLLIQYWTRNKRQALSTDGKTFESRFLRLDLASDIGVRPEHESTENGWDANRILKNSSGTERVFFNALAGNYEAGVSLFIGADNTEAVEVWDYPAYVKAVAEYCSISPDQVTQIFAKFRYSHPTRP